MRTTDLARVLQLAVGVVGAVVFLSGLTLIVAGYPGPGVMTLLPGLVMLLVALYEVTRYRGHGDESTGSGGEPVPWGQPAPGQTPAGPRLEPTGEVFLDPTTGERLRVWHDPTTGERRYVPDTRN